MSRHRFTFRVYAVDESDYWELPPEHPLHGRRAWGVYFFLVGERTHICSFTPSSRADWLRNQFDLPDGFDTDSDELATLENDNGGEWSTYFDFIDPRRQRDYVSRPFTWTIDSDDVDTSGVPAAARELIRDGASPAAAWSQARRDACRDNAWQEASEYLAGNWQDVPAMRGAGLARHIARGLAREAAAATLEARKAAAPAAYDAFLSRTGLTPETHAWSTWTDSPEFAALPTV